jgi:ribosomal protein S18 acetylase RimI-like enzyme
MGNEFIFGALEPERLGEALALVRDVYLTYDSTEDTEEGVAEFLRYTGSGEIEKAAAERKLGIWTCEADGKIVGMLAAGPDHIHLLFVDGDYHRRGIARRLAAIMDCHFGVRAVTVNSSRYAVEMYRKLGFSEASPERIENGILFIPMIRDTMLRTD